MLGLSKTFLNLCGNFARGNIRSCVDVENLGGLIPGTILEMMDEDEGAVDEVDDEEEEDVNDNNDDEFILSGVVDSSENERG
jgi:hypothetical protein